jgi:diguanylate cyclase (GGDEF)-like protein/PAS domain S-box-containing protein
VLIARDITRRKKAENDLKLREEEFKALVEHSPDAIVRFDAARHITYTNAIFQTKFNLTSTSLIGKSCAQSGLPQDLSKKWDDALLAVLNTGIEKNLDYEFHLGKWNRIYNARFSPEFDKSNHVIAVLAISRDITDHVNAETHLREAETRYRHIFNQGTDALVHLDQQSVIVDVNDRAIELAGRSRDDLIGNKLDAMTGLFTKESIAAMVDAFKKRMAGIEVLPYEVEMKPNSGHSMFFEISAALLIDSTGSKIGEIAVLHDITNRKIEEEKVVRQSEALARRGEELSGLFEISSTISNTLEMNQLLDKTLKKITSLKIIDFQPEAGIFILEGDRLKLAASTEASDDFLEAHVGLRYGQCLCGIAAQEGEIIVSRSSTYDTRHSISYEGMKNHGDIIVPLKTPNGVSGVMFLHTEPNINIREHDMDLLHTIGNQLGVAIENAKLYEQTKALSLHDPLTGLANRNMMDIELEKSMARCRRTSEPFSLLMIDLDHFKRFNDTYGHAVGDDLLIALARILEFEIREVDSVIRYGGEEFLVIMPQTPIDVALGAAERIRKKVETEDFQVGDDLSTHITISLGAATSTDGSESTTILMTRADTALYLAKERGRNRVERWVD